MADLKQWLAQGANPDNELAMPSSPTTWIGCAICSQHGAHVDARDGEGNTPLINATRFGFVDVATYLLEHKADVNLGRPQQLDAAHVCRLAATIPSCVTMLIEARRQDSMSCRQRRADAACHRRAKCQDQGRRGAGRRRRRRQCARGEGRLHAAHARGHFRARPISRLRSSSHGAKVNAVNPGGVTALMIAAANNHSQGRRGAARSRARISNARSEDGRTALSIAQANNNERVIQIAEGRAERRSPCRRASTAEC